MVKTFLAKYHQNILDYSFALFAFLISLSKALPNILIIPVGSINFCKVIVVKTLKLPLFWLMNLILLILILFLAFTQQFFIEELNFQKEYIASIAVFLNINEVSKIKTIELSFVADILGMLLFLSMLIYPFIKSTKSVKNEK